MSSSPVRRKLLLIESGILFLALPVAMAIANSQGIRVGFLVLFTLMGYCLARLFRDPNFKRSSLVTWRHLPAELPGILFRFVIGGGILTLLVWRLDPEWFLYFPKNRFHLWAWVMVLYPFLSVYPQEIIYRAFIYQRAEQWKPGDARFFIIVSSIAYALVHIIYLNALAPLMCLAGGVMFARTYLKNRSLAGVTLEHALWGDLVFTIGLGRYFYSGNVGP